MSNQGSASIIALALTVCAATAVAQAGHVRQTAYVKAPNPEPGDHFGNGGTVLGDSVSISNDGNTIAVGAPGKSRHTGAVYVFARSGGAWTLQASLTASNAREGAEFGHVVAISADGNTLAVSSHLESGGAIYAGAVYVFTRAGSRWSEQAYIKASNAGERTAEDAFPDGDHFGFAMALSDDGNTLAVGANAEDSRATGINGNQSDNSMPQAGAVYVFSRDGGTWTQQAYVKASNTVEGMQFGYSVSLSADGNTLAVGGYEEGGTARTIDGPQTRGRNGSGAVYVFARRGAAWAQQAYIKPSNADQGDSFGAAVALSDDGNTLVGGSLDEDCDTRGAIVTPPPRCADDFRTPAAKSSGAAYVFVRDGGRWSQQAFLKASNTGPADWFGSRLAISGDGDTIAAGAQLEDGPGETTTEAGAAHVFRRRGRTWTHIAYVKADNTRAFDEFGSSVSLNRDGTAMAAGARGEDGGAEEAGAAYVFSIAPREP